MELFNEMEISKRRRSNPNVTLIDVLNNVEKSSKHTKSVLFAFERASSQAMTRSDIFRVILKAQWSSTPQTSSASRCKCLGAKI